MQSLKSIRPAEVDNFFKQSFEQKKLIPLYLNKKLHCSPFVLVVAWTELELVGQNFAKKRQEEGPEEHGEA